MKKYLFSFFIIICLFVGSGYAQTYENCDSGWSSINAGQQCTKEPTCNGGYTYNPDTQVCERNPGDIVDGIYTRCSAKVTFAGSLNKSRFFSAAPGAYSTMWQYSSDTTKRIQAYFAANCSQFYIYYKYTGNSRWNTGGAGYFYLEPWESETTSKHIYTNIASSYAQNTSTVTCDTGYHADSNYPGKCLENLSGEATEAVICSKGSFDTDLQLCKYDAAQLVPYGPEAWGGAGVENKHLYMKVEAF